MAKHQPTLTELTELLFQQVVYLQETTKRNIAQQVELSDKISSIDVKVTCQSSVILKLKIEKGYKMILLYFNRSL